MDPGPRAILLHPNDGCLTIARALVRRGVAVHALVDPRHSYVLAARGVTGRVAGDPATWTAELQRLASDGGGVVICGSDAASEWVQRHRAQLPASLRTFETADGPHRTLMDKFELYRIAPRAGVRAPWLHHVTGRAELAALRASVPLPCVLKPDLGHVAKASVGFGTQLVDSRETLDDRAGRLLDRGLSFVLTELVPGPETALLGAVTVRDAQGRYPLEYGRRKIRQWPLDYGVGSLTESADVPEALAAARRLVEHTGFVGVSSCEFKRHAVTGELFLVEINVRVPASYGLAEACEADGAWRLYATLAGLELPEQPRPVAGRKVMLYSDLLAAWTRVRRGDAGVLEVLASWRGVRDVGVLDPRDPRPMLALARQVLGRRLAAVRARLRRNPPAAPVAAGHPPTTAREPSAP
ncbi:MAG TPA: hypothetical protein VM367_02410 [Pseudonocardia sp.]|jgi:D-aspartate ligase|nr:hypothetical protein [Pseudonocardia sp.]